MTPLEVQTLFEARFNEELFDAPVIHCHERTVTSMDGTVPCMAYLTCEFTGADRKCYRFSRSFPLTFHKQHITHIADDMIHEFSMKFAKAGGYFDPSSDTN